MADGHPDEQSGEHDAPLRRFIDPDFLDFYSQIEVTRRDAMDRAAELPAYSAAAVLALLDRSRVLPSSEPDRALAARSAGTTPSSVHVGADSPFGTAEPLRVNETPPDPPWNSATVNAGVYRPGSPIGPPRGDGGPGMISEGPTPPVSEAIASEESQGHQTEALLGQGTPMIGVDGPAVASAIRASAESIPKSEAPEKVLKGLERVTAELSHASDVEEASNRSLESSREVVENPNGETLPPGDRRRTLADLAESRRRDALLAPQPDNEEIQTEPSGAALNNQIPAGAADFLAPAGALAEPPTSRAAKPASPVGPGPALPLELLNESGAAVQGLPDAGPNSASAESPGAGKVDSRSVDIEPPRSRIDAIGESPPGGSTATEAGRDAFLAELAEQVELSIGPAEARNRPRLTEEPPVVRTSGEANADPRNSQENPLALRPSDSPLGLTQTSAGVRSENQAPTRGPTPEVSLGAPQTKAAIDALGEPNVPISQDDRRESSVDGAVYGGGSRRDDSESKSPPVWGFSLDDPPGSDRIAPLAASTSSPTIDLGSVEEQRASLERRRAQARDERNLPGIVFPPGPADLPPPPPKRDLPGIEFPPGPADLRPPTPPRRLPGIEFPPGPAAMPPEERRPSAPTIDLGPTPTPRPTAPIIGPNAERSDERPISPITDQRTTPPNIPPRVNRPRTSRVRSTTPPRRRDRRPEILARLLAGPASAQELATDFEISREGVLRWLRQLEADGTIRSTATARTSRVNKWVLVEQPLTEPEMDG